MRTLLILLTALLPLETHAARFACVPLHPPREQGEERFYRVELTATSAKLEVADLVSPYRNLAEGLTFSRAWYSDSATSAGAAWAKHGRDELVLSLVYLGSWWGGNLRAGGEDSDLRCHLQD